MVIIYIHIGIGKGKPRSGRGNEVCRFDSAKLKGIEASQGNIRRPFETHLSGQKAPREQLRIENYLFRAIFLNSAVVSLMATSTGSRSIELAP